MSSFLKRSLWLLAGLTLLVVLAWKKFPQPRAAASRPVDRAAAAPTPALKVTTRDVQPVAFAETVRSTGTLRANESIELQVEVSGKVTAISFTEGGLVKKGDLLVKINDADLQASLKRGVHRREILALSEQRLKSLLSFGGVPQHEYDAAVNEVSVAEAEMDLVKAQLSKTEIRAPFDGEIGLRFVSEGAFITATSNGPIRIATLQSIDRIKLDFSVPEKYASRVRVGGPVTFSVEDGGKTYRGEIAVVERRVDIATRTVSIRAVVPNHDRLLLPGASANVECPLVTIGDAIMVPSEAVLPGIDGKTVFLAVNGKAERRSVILGTRTQSQVQVVEGLAPGDRLIISNFQQLRDGLKVQPVDELTAAALFESAGESGSKLAEVPSTRRE